MSIPTWSSPGFLKLLMVAKPGSENPCNGLNFGFQSNFAWYFGKIRINPFNPLDIWLLGVESWRSQDGGESWELDGFQQGVHADHHDLAFPTLKRTCLLPDGGLYRSTDNANAWQKIENIPTTQFYRVAYKLTPTSVLLWRAQDNGTSKGNAANLENWMSVFGGDGFQAVCRPFLNPNIYYYEFQNGSIYGTTNGGNFDPATQGIDENDRHWDMQYAISNHDENVMYTGTYRMYQGFGHLPIWTPISQDLTDGNIFGSRYHTISSVHESPLDPDLIYVGTTDAGNIGAETQPTKHR